jgi:superfamily II DNA or RNA helicase
MAISGEDDFEYHPVLADASSFLGESNAARFLLIGEPLGDAEGVPHGVEEVAERRHRNDRHPPESLPVGNYRFRTPTGCGVMLVTCGAAPISPQRGNATSGGHTFLDRANAWFEHLWTDAQAIPRPAFLKGAVVITVPGGRETSVRSRVFGGGEWRYRVRLDGKMQTFREGGLAHAHVDDDPWEWVRRTPGGMREIAATLTRAKLDEHLTDTVYSFGATRTVFRAYQFRPVMKLLRTGRKSMLIADEVGLGKTIEAGLIWTELDARRQADRVLVVCPSGLVDKWRQEMSERFGFETERLNSALLDELLEQFETDRVPARFRAVCSLERLRIWDGLSRLNGLAPHFDLIIVDEAHALRNLGTRSHALGAQLSDWAGTLVFLSATPLNLGNDDLFNLLELLNPDEFDDRYALQTMLEPNAVLNRVSASLTDNTVLNHHRRAWLQAIRSMTFGRPVTDRPEYRRLDEILAQQNLRAPEKAEASRLLADLNTLSSVVTRTRKAEVDEDKTVRDAEVVDVTLTEAERRLYDAIYEWQCRRADARNMPVYFIGQMPLRLAGSCLQAAKRQIVSMNGGGGHGSWGDEDGAFDDTSNAPEADATRRGGDTFDPHAWDTPPVDVVSAARALGDADTKFDEFVEALSDMVGRGRKVLVFTFSRPTVAYLGDRLSERFRTCFLHGGVPPSERREVIRRFRDGDFDVMLATRVAGEGLDFEFCSAVVNYDLPWNPMEVEQRIGRIDRFGQQEEKIHILNFRTPGTIETDIIARVHERIGVFTASIGELEPILRAELPNLRRTMFDFTLSSEERSRKIDQALTAIELKAGIRKEVESAAELLNVLDNAEVDGFENEVRTKGRYVGQPELVWLLEDWAASAPGAVCRRADDGPWLHFTGNATLAEHLLGVQADRERSRSEITSLHADLRNENEITLCLDQETARRRGIDLLNATHPLVRAALRVPRTRQTPYGAVRIRTSAILPGRYLVLVAVARWDGIRPATELWTAAAAGDGEPVGENPGAALLAALSEAALEPLSGEATEWEARHVRACFDQISRRHTEEDDRRKAENSRLVEARQISLAETHRRRTAGISQRIDALGEEPKAEITRLFQSQLDNQHHRYEEARHQLDQARAGSLSLEEIALCSMEVVR